MYKHCYCWDDYEVLGWRKREESRWRCSDWLQKPEAVIGAFFCHFFAWGTALSFGVFWEHLHQEFDAGIEEIGLIQGIMCASIQASSVVAMIATHYLDRPFASLLCGMFLFISGHVSIAFAGDLPVIYLAAGFGLGVGGGFLTAPSIASVIAYFSQSPADAHRSCVTIAIACGSGMGAFVLPYLYTGLMYAGISWRMCLLIAGAISMIVLFPMNLTFLRSRDVDVGRPTLKERWRGGGFISIRFGLLAVASLLFHFAYFNANIYLAPYALVSLRMDPWRLAVLLSLIGIASATARASIGGIMDHIPVLPAWITIVALKVIASVLVPVCANFASLAVICIVAGVGHGAGVLLPHVVHRHMDVDDNPLVYGILCALSSVGTTIGSWTTGMLIGQLDHMKSFLLVGSSVILGTLALAFLPFAPAAIQKSSSISVASPTYRTDVDSSTGYTSIHAVFTEEERPGAHIDLSAGIPE